MARRKAFAASKKRKAKLAKKYYKRMMKLSKKHEKLANKYRAKAMRGY